jgi:hypothetical protein
LSVEEIPMQQFPLAYASGHFLATIGGERWIIDTGSPASFGRSTTLQLDGVSHTVSGEYFGLSGKTLTSLVGEELSGLIGTDILNSVDVQMDPVGGSLVLSAQPIEMEGTGIELDEFMGVPILEATSASQTHRMFFDTGAQVSYFQHDSFEAYETAGQLQDFFPGMGEFTTDTRLVPFKVGPLEYRLRCGQLPGLLGMTLGMAGVDGIVGPDGHPNSPTHGHLKLPHLS